MIAAAKVASDLRAAVVGSLVVGAREVAATAQRELEPFRGEQSVAPRLDALDKASAALDACSRDDLQALARCLGELRTALAAAIESVVPPGNVAPASLSEGKFAAALADVLASRRQKPLGDAAPFLAAIRSAVSSAEAPAAVAPAPINASLVALAQPEVDEPVTIRAVLRDGDVGAAQVSIDWYFGERLVKPGVPGDLDFETTPSSVDPFVLRAELRADGRHGTATMRIAPLPSYAIDPIEMQRRAKRERWKQTAVSFALIVPVGWLVFYKTFVGHPEDFAAAALWGFAADVTLPKLLALAAPVASKLPSWQ
jgi:hypothetical protein